MPDDPADPPLSSDREAENPLDERHPVEALAEEFVRRHRNGECPDVEEYALAHPADAEQIRALFPTVLAMEGLADSTRREIESGTAGASVQRPPLLERLGDFRVVAEIGRGGMGIVYEAQQESLGRRVAVKVLPRQAVLDSARRDRFHREARTAARLHHTNIVPVFGTGEDDGHHYFVMQLIRGIGLDQVLATLRGEPATRAPATDGSHLSLEVAGSLLHIDGFGQGTVTTADLPRAYYRAVARIGQQVAEALAYAHEQGTLHRDVKPANLLLDGSGRCWVTDFGLAKALEQEDLTGSGDLVGTLRYLAPEALHGLFDARGDQFSLGLTLYELLSLAPARGGGARGALLDSVQRELPALARINPSVPPDLATIVTKACALDPSHRYPNAAALADDLGAFLAGRPVRARRISLARTALRWCSRNRGIAAAGAIALLALLAAGVTGWVTTLTTTRALDRAVREGSRAERNLELTLDAFDDVFESLCGQDLALAVMEDEDTGDFTVAEQSALRASDLELLQRLLAFYRAFADANAENADLALETARAYRRVGDIHRQLGNFEDAATASSEALALLTAHQTPPPLELALVHNSLGRVALALGDRATALRQHQQALAVLEAADETPVLLLEQAQTHNLLGIAWVRRERGNGIGGAALRAPGRRAAGAGRQNWGVTAESRATAVASHERALAITRRLLAEAPGKASLQFLEAQCLRHLAQALPPTEHALSEQHRADAMALLEGLASRYPSADRYSAALVEALLGGGNRLRLRPARDPGQAARIEQTARLEQALPLSRTLVERNPQVPEYRRQLARVYESLALTASLRQQPADAKQFAASAIREAVRTEAGIGRVERWILNSATRILAQNPAMTQEEWTPILDELERFIGPEPADGENRATRAAMLDVWASALRAAGQTVEAEQREAAAARLRNGRRRPRGGD